MSVDSVYSHKEWAARALGGIGFPIVADFHPKGHAARLYGCWIEAEGLADRATVLIDKDGYVAYAASAGIDGRRDMHELLAICRREALG